MLTLQSRQQHTIAEHFVVRALARFGKEDAKFEVDGALLLFQQQQLLLHFRVCRYKRKTRWNEGFWQWGHSG